MLANKPHYLSYLLWLCLASMPLFSTALRAAEVSDLYVAEVPVGNQSAAERKRVLQQALIHVMVKVSGSTQVALTPGMPELLKKAASFVREYRYQSAPVANATDNAVQTVLWVRFSSRAVNDALQKLALPVWGRARPATLVWLAFDDQGERGLMNGADHPEVMELINQQADVRGLPLLWPLLDLQDQTQISFADIWANFQDRILAASQRYQSEAILVGRLLHRGEDFWETRWNLLSTDINLSWDAAGNITDVMPVGIDNTADVLATRYARAGDVGSSLLRVKITDLNSATAYAKSEKFLRELEPVETIQLVSLDSNNVVFKIKLRGSQQDLVQALELSNEKLFIPLATETPPVTPAPDAPVLPAMLTYRFLQ